MDRQKALVVEKTKTERDKERKKRQWADDGRKEANIENNKQPNFSVGDDFSQTYKNSKREMAENRMRTQKMLLSKVGDLF